MEAEAKAKEEADAKAKAEAEAKAKEEAEAKAKADAEARAQAEAEAKAKEEAEARAKAETREQERAHAETVSEPVRADEAAPVSSATLPLQPGDEETQTRIAALIGKLEDREPTVRDSVVAALAQMGPPAVAPLTAAMEAENWIVRQGASQALGRIGDPRAVEPLIRALEDKNQWIRRYAAEALGRIGDEQATEPLVTALKDDSSVVRAAAAKALESIRGGASRPQADFAAPQEQASASKGRRAGTIIGRLIDLKIYIGAGVAACLVLGGLATVLLRRRGNP